MSHYNNIPYIKVMKGTWSQNLNFLLKNCQKLPYGKKVDFWVFVNHAAVHSGTPCWRAVGKNQAYKALHPRNFPREVFRVQGIAADTIPLS